MGAPPPGSSLPSLHGLRVLLVDDERDCLETAAIVLEHAGAEVLCVTNGPAALLQSVVFTPNVLVSDIAMPLMDGYDLLQKFRASGSSIPAIAFSAHAEQRYVDQAIRAGFNAYLIKPVDPHALIASLLQVTGRRADGAPSSRQ